MYQFSICGVSVITPWDPPGVGGRGGRCRDHIIDGPFSILRRFRGKGRWGGELGGLVEKEGKVMKELKEPKIIYLPKYNTKMPGGTVHTVGSSIGLYSAVPTMQDF